ncbi:MAG TPA: glycine--tRNA ligase [Candidatus Saccharimonadales bacterium]|nr:glycine--tRNA ligase [Candidatus Saccharimonadales bacterium]
MSKSEVSLDTLVSLAKRRGFVFQASEIYGGLAGFWDYGPYGVELMNNIKKLWWKAMVYENRDIYGIDSAIIQNPKLWEASGHVAGFNDPLVDCKNCKARHRADHLAEVDTTDLEELAKLLKDKACPTCGKKMLTEPRTFNMMMKTWVGPLQDDSAVAYLRPETAGPMFTNFENVRETTRSKIPFGIAQIGKAFRNEISPRDFIFRSREFEQAEMQYFIHPGKQHEVYERWRSWAWDFYVNRVGLAEKNLSWHEHGETERAHYAAAAHDIYYKFPHGSKELCGTHNRTDFDLKGQMNGSGKDLSYFDEETRERFTPNVIESSVGMSRFFMAVLTDAYNEEKVGNETRIVLKIKPELAPVKAAVLPLSKKPELQALSDKVYKQIVQETGWNIEYDETQSIGKRYRRQDEIGTPYCITIDFDSISDNSVTIRERDSMEQKRIKIKEITSAIVL